MSVAIEKRDEKIDALQSRLSNLRRAANEEAKELMGTATGFAAAYGYGALEAKAEARGAGIASPIDGVDPMLMYGGLGMVAGRVVGGDAGLALSNGGRALLTIKAYKAGRESARPAGR